MFSIDKEQNITLTRGDTALLTIGLEYKNGQPYTPREGDRLRFALGKNWGKDTILIKEIPLDTGLLEIEPADTKDLPFKVYKYDVEFTDADGHVDTLLIGEFVVDKEVY